MRGALLTRIDPSRRVARWVGNIMPESLFLPGLFLPEAVRFRADQIPLSESGRLALGDLARKQDEIAIEIDARATLVRTVRLPKAAAGMADDAVRVQLRQTLPGQAQGLIWQISPGTAEGDFIRYEVYILRADDLLALRQSVTTGGARVTSVHVAGMTGRPIWLADEKRSKRAQTAAMGAVLAVLLMALVPIWWLSAESRALADANAAKMMSVAALELKLGELSASANTADTREADLRKDMARFIQQSRWLSLMGDMAQALPTTVWLSEMSLSGQEMRLSGFSSGDATEVLRILQGRPWAESARMDGPIRFDSLTQQNRFSIWIGLKGAAL
jgi:general secretion pathway protein L